MRAKNPLYIAILALIGAALLATGCGSSAGAGGGGGGGIVSGSACNQTTQQELCSGSVRMTCVAGTWQATELCATGQICLAQVGATPGTLVTVCKATGSDAGPSDGSDAKIDAPGGIDVPVLDADVAAPDVQIVQPDIQVAETSSGCTGASECDDGVPCTIDACPSDGVCSHKAQNFACNDDDPCTQDLCQGASGCSHPIATGPCDDGDPCTSGDKCLGGQCGGLDKDCDDGNDCTLDNCASGQCKHAPIAGCGASSMATATLLTPADQATGALDPTGTIDWYKFTGKKGQLVYIQVLSSQSQAGNEFDPTIIDTTLTLYGADQQPYAFNDDSGNDNDSAIWTVLPADGTYYAKVEECWTFIAESPDSGSVCAGDADKDDADYAIFFDVVSPNTAKSVVQDKELGDTAANPTPMTFEKTTDGKAYYQDLVYGLFKSISDIDVFSLTLPLDTPVKDGRATLYVEGTDGGAMGNGSSCAPGIAWLTTQAKPTTILAKVDLDNGYLSVPVTLGQALLLFVQHPPGVASSHDFYVLQQSAAGSNPLEQSEVGNDTLAGAEKLASVQQNDATIYFVAGDLLSDAKDVDHFTVAVPFGVKKVTAYCGAAAMGSGLQDLQLDILKSDGNAVAGGTGQETAAQLALKDIAVPSGQTKLVMRVSAGGQDPEITGIYYQCAFVFKQ